MWNSIKSVAALLLSFGLLILANGMFATLLGLRAKLEGFSTETIGLVMAGHFVGLLLGAVYAVRAVRAVGHIRAFATFASILSVAVLTHILVIDPVVWFVLRIMAGFCMAGMVMVVESWLNERSVNATRGQIFSLYMTINYFSAGLGQFALTLGDPARFELFVIASIVFSLALVPVLMTGASAPKPVSPQRLKFRELFAISPLGVAGAMCAGLINATINSLGPVFASDSGLDLTKISAFMAVVIMGGIVLQFPVGRLSDLWDRRSVMLITTVAATLAALAVVEAGNHAVFWLFVAGAVYGAFCYTIYPLSAAQINDLADPDKLVQISSGLLIAYGSGAVCGPIIASQLMGRYGPQGMFYFIAAVTGTLALYVVWRMMRRNRSDKSKVAYLPLGVWGLSSRQLYTTTLSALRRASKKGSR
jgi:MFS family permease